VVAYLLARLGRTLTAFIAGSESRAMPARWAAPPGDSAHSEPSIEEARRLKAAHAVFRSLEDAENDQVERTPTADSDVDTGFQFGIRSHGSGLNHTAWRVARPPTPIWLRR
jgi:hypothetical protein